MDEISSLESIVYDYAHIMPFLGNINSYMTGVFESNGRHIEYANSFSYGRYRYAISPLLASEKFFSGKYIYGGQILHQYGHFLLETLSRIWFIKKNPQLPVVWVGNGDFTLWEQQIFNILNIENKKLVVKKPSTFEKLIVPLPGFMIPNFFHPEQINSLAVYSSEIQKHKCIYLSRSNISSRCINEDEIENILSHNGFEIVFPEKISVEEQLNKICSSNIVFAIEGSALHNIVLAKNNIKTTFIVLPRHMSPTYQLIADCKGIRYYTLLNNYTFSSGQNFIIDTDALKKIINETECFRKITKKYFVKRFVTPLQLNNIMQLYKLQNESKNESKKLYYLSKHCNKLFLKSAYYSPYCDADTAFEYSNYCIKNNNNTDAINAALKALNLSQNNDKYKTFLYNLLNEKNDKKNKLISSDNKFSSANTFDNNPLKQIAYIKSALALNPNNIFYKKKLIKCYTDLGNFFEAEKKIKECIAYKFDLDWAHYELSHLYYRKKLINNAITECHYALEFDISPTFINKLCFLCTLYRENKQFSISNKIIELALSINKDIAWPYYFFSINLYNNKYYSEAIRYIKKAIKLDPKHTGMKLHLLKCLKSSNIYSI